MMQVLIDCGHFNWELLRAQKERLVEASEHDDHLQGIVHLLDHVQDEAAKILSPYIVFGEVPNRIKYNLTAYYVSGIGEMVIYAPNKRVAYSQGVEEFGRGGTRECRVATEQEINRYCASKGCSIDEIMCYDRFGEWYR